MKTKQFSKTQFTQPERDRDGTWSFQEFPPLGGDILHSDFASRTEARSVRKMLINFSPLSDVAAEIEFAR